MPASWGGLMFQLQFITARSRILNRLARAPRRAAQDQPQAARGGAAVKLKAMNHVTIFSPSLSRLTVLRRDISNEPARLVPDA